MALKIYNTMSRKLEEFKPMKQGEVGLYTCGLTVYYYAHVGNLRSYVFADVLKRTLMYNGLKVKQVMNITDVGHLTSDEDTGEDKMEKAKEREGKTAWEIAKFYEKAFLEDLDKMNIIRADLTPRATEEIPAQIDLIKKIEANGFAYQIDDGVYFDTSKLEDYGKLARLDIENLRAGARIEMVKGKKSPTDFALWKFSPKDKKRDMEWKSPWGIGFPGWHLECSVMSMKYLGDVFDIHTGGVDHIPVHHTNEIAQSVAANGKEPVNYWMHNEFLIVKDSKMSKSTGDIITLKTLAEKGYDAMDYRYLLLSAHYRKQLTFTWESLDNIKNTMHRLKKIILDIKTAEKGQVDQQYKQRFLEAVNDDLKTPEALAVMWEMLRDSELSNGDKYATMLDFDKILGLRLDEIKETKEKIPKEIMDLIKQREEARKNKGWSKADQLRNEIREKGYEISDTPEGPKITKI